MITSPDGTLIRSPRQSASPEPDLCPPTGALPERETADRLSSIQSAGSAWISPASVRNPQSNRPSRQ